MAELSEILGKLLRQTHDNRVRWTTTAEDNTYAAVVGTLSVITQLNFVGDAILQILSSEGRQIEAMDTGSLSGFEFKTELFSLHQMARRIALGTDSALDELSQALDSLSIDDLPF